MRLSKSRTDHALVIGFYQSPETAGTTLEKLRREGFRKSAAMHCTASGEVRVDGHGSSAARWILGSALIGLLLGIVAWRPPHGLEPPGGILGLALSLA